MKSLMRARTFAAVVMLCAGFSCSINTTSSMQNGGTTEVTNARLQGTVYYEKSATGTQPESIAVAHARLYLHSPFFGTKTSQSDANGSFIFDSIKEGSYWLEVNSSDSLGNLQDVQVKRNDTHISIPCSAKHMGGIRGVILLDSSYQGDPAAVFGTTVITLPQVNLQLSVDSLGRYESGPIPPYLRYSLVLSNAAYPLVNDTVTVAVREGISTIINGTIPLIMDKPEDMNSVAFYGEEYRDTIHAFDWDGDTVLFSFAAGSPGMKIADSIISWMPQFMGCCNRQVSVTVCACDNKEGCDTLRWVIYIQKR